MKIYIAGAISNNPNYEEQFKAAELKLTSEGYEVINPAKNQGHSYREFIDIGLFELMKCDAIYLLEGFSKSKGAWLEYRYAVVVGLKILFERNGDTE